jgi:hypothetical protein
VALGAHVFGCLTRRTLFVGGRDLDSSLYWKSVYTQFRSLSFSSYPPVTKASDRSFGKLRTCWEDSLGAVHNYHVPGLRALLDSFAVT